MPLLRSNPVKALFFKESIALVFRLSLLPEKTMNTTELTAYNTQELADSNSTWRDWLGIVASIGCAIHCAAMPFVIAYLPTLGLSFLADESFHKWMALVCFLIAIVAFIPGIRKHGNWTPVSVGAIGLVLITFAAFGLAGECCASCEANVANSSSSTSLASGGQDAGCDQCSQCTSCNLNSSETDVASTSENDERKELLSVLAPWLTPLGGVILVCAHLLNRRYGCLCGCC